MLFKTRDSSLEDGFFYYELPKNFKCEITQKEGWFAFEDSIILCDTSGGVKTPQMPEQEISRIDSIKMEQAKEQNKGYGVIPNLVFVNTGIKHLFFIENERQKNIFFVENGYIIKEKGKTIETL